MTDDPPAPTVVDRPQRTKGASAATLRPTIEREPTAPTAIAGSEPGKSVATTATTIGSPIDALRHAEMLRNRNFSLVCIGIAIAGAVAVLSLPRGGIPKAVFLGAIAAAIAALSYLVHRSRRPATYRQDLGMTIAWLVPALAVGSAVPYFGPYSPVPILAVLGIYVLGMGSSVALGWAVYVISALIQATAGVLPILGIADPGFIKASYLPTEIQIFAQVLLQVVLLGSFVIARWSRRSHLIALGELERAIRAVGQREALLEEAREELRRALGRGRGRFSEQVIGSYKLGDLIGRGAMGEVYEAVDSRSGDAVAVKMLAQASLGNAQHVQRFLRELRTAATIASPHVVKVLEVGEEPLPYLAMERLRGKDLATILRDKRPLTPDKVVDLVRQVGDGVSAAGAAGIVHRDLKPQNVFLAGTTWKVLDFGVARAADSGDTLTAGHVVGTPAYMAPEQARGSGVDHRTDLYALAAIAYRALTGHAPFAGGEIADVLYRVVHTAPRAPSRLTQLPAEVDLVLAIGMAKAPEDRFANADAFAQALAAALTGTLPAGTRARGQRLVDAGAWAR